MSGKGVNLLQEDHLNLPNSNWQCCFEVLFWRGVIKHIKWTGRKIV